jgi:hypothetical protein
VLFNFAREAAGASRTWLSLRPLLSEGQDVCITRARTGVARSWARAPNAMKALAV